jgi:hypothetical protein
MLIKEGEVLSKAFAFACLEEFVKKRGYVMSDKEVDSQGRILVEKIRRKGIKKALREISKAARGELLRNVLEGTSSPLQCGRQRE